jgi:hypothetical protein
MGFGNGESLRHLQKRMDSQGQCDLTGNTLVIPKTMNGTNTPRFPPTARTLAAGLEWHCMHGIIESRPWGVGDTAMEAICRAALLAVVG